MKKLLLILVAAILALILPAGVVVAKTVANRIEFNLDDGTYEIGGTDVSASVVLTGNLREKDTNIYLSPLKGTITIDGEKYDISVKAEKQSDPLIHRERRHIGMYRYDVDLQYIMVNVKGSKASGPASYSGTLRLGEDSHDRGVTWEFFSELDFKGTVDGEPFRCTIRGPFPIID